MSHVEPGPSKVAQKKELQLLGDQRARTLRILDHSGDSVYMKRETAVVRAQMRVVEQKVSDRNENEKEAGWAKNATIQNNY